MEVYSDAFNSFIKASFFYCLWGRHRLLFRLMFLKVIIQLVKYKCINSCFYNGKKDWKLRGFLDDKSKNPLLWFSIREFLEQVQYYNILIIACILLFNTVSSFIFIISAYCVPLSFHSLRLKAVTVQDVPSFLLSFWVFVLKVRSKVTLLEK